MARFRSGYVATLGLCVLLSLGSGYLLLITRESPCERRAPVTVLATLAAFLIALCFRQLASSPDRAQGRTLILCLVLAASALFADVRFVLKYRGICNQLQEQLHQLNHPGS